MENSLLLTYLLLILFIGSIAILFIKADKGNLIRYFGLGISVIAFLLSLVIYFNFDSSNSSFQFVHKFKWIENLNIHYHVGIDGMALLLLVLTTFLTPLTLISSWTSINKKVKGNPLKQNNKIIKRKQFNHISIANALLYLFSLPPV